MPADAPVINAIGCFGETAAMLVMLKAYVFVKLLPILGITFIDILGFSILIPLMPYFVKHFGAPDIVVGALFAVFALCQFVGGPFWGNVSDRIGRKAVLILGRFTPERKEVLDAIREELRKRNYLPLMFDFDRPADRSLIETVVTLGHLSRFVIADITDAKVVLQELQAIVPQLPTLPVMPIVQAGAPMTAAIADFSTNANFIADIFEYLDIGQIRDLLPTAVIAPAEARRAKIESDRAAFEAKYLKKI